MANLGEIFARKKREAAAAAAAAAATTSSQLSSSATAPTTAAPNAARTCTVPPRRIVLFIDTVPLKTTLPVTSAEDWSVHLRKKVETDHRVIDWRLIEYGRGRAVLAGEARKALESSDYSMAVTVRSDSELGRALLDVLNDFATEIYLGIA